MSTATPARSRAQPADFGGFVRAAGARGELVVQPRQGFADPVRMREGLVATRAARATTVGTITLDSYTRVGAHAAAEHAVRTGIPLNGYPITTHPPEVTDRVLAGVAGPDFPVQVRHGSADPRDIFAALVALGIGASEGGPVSYCLPYSRTPLDEAVRSWRTSCAVFAELRERGVEPHLETFGGCMLGQLCPPSQLVALSVLEALFFCAQGLTSVSVSYAQQTDMAQDVEAVHALRRLCTQLLPTDSWHVVIYAYMGLYPVTDHGAHRLLAQAAELAARTGAERVIVKTVAESRRIPTIAENVVALEYAAAAARRVDGDPGPGADAAITDTATADTETYLEAQALVEAVLNLHPDVGRALTLAFKQGYLDIPYCLHPDNAGRATSYIDDRGRLRWGDTGSLALPRVVSHRRRRVTSSGLLADLSYMRNKFDSAEIDPAAAPPVGVDRGRSRNLPGIAS